MLSHDNSPLYQTAIKVYPKWIKDGVVIIDVGINREEDHLCGDVNPNVEEKCSYLTPVPGGVGPMTVAMLLKNTLIAYKRQNGIEDE